MSVLSSSYQSVSVPYEYPFGIVRRADHVTGIIQAVTNQQTGLNIITEMIVGYMLPGKPIAMMMFSKHRYLPKRIYTRYSSDY